MSRIQNIAFQSILIFMSLSLIIFIIGCDQFPSPLRGKKAINLVMLLDCSSSTMTDRSFQEQSILEAAGWWAEKAAEGSKGKFEILIINNGIDDIISFYSQRMPETFPMPAGQSKKYWIMDFKKDLQNAVKGLPSRTGSAVIEGIFISSRRLNEYDGDKFLIIYSDMRQFTPGIWNFEKEIPEPDRFKKWIDQQYLNPLLDPDTQVTVCGFKPYLANNDTVKISPVEYGKLQNLWLSIFKGWGRKVILTETFNPKNVYGGNKNE